MVCLLYGMIRLSFREYSMRVTGRYTGGPDCKKEDKEDPVVY